MPKFNVYIKVENVERWKALGPKPSAWVNQKLQEEPPAKEVNYRREGEDRFEEDWQPPSQISF